MMDCKIDGSASPCGRAPEFQPVCLHFVGAPSVFGGGGSNTFIRGLASRQVALGWRPIIVINAVGESEACGVPEEATGAVNPNVPIRCLPPVAGTDRKTYYSRRPASVPGVSDLFAELRPSVVHFHTLNQMAGPLHLEAAKRAGARTIVTYHTGGISCPQTGLLENGRSPCDGRLEVTRCTRCRFANRGMPAWLASLAAQAATYSTSEASSLSARLLSSRAMTELFISSFRASLRWIDVFHIQARWIAAVLRANGVPGEKLAYVEMGVAQAPIPLQREVPLKFDRTRPLRLVFAGRCSDIKGIETILGALGKLSPAAPVELSLLGSGWETRYGKRLLERCGGDGRVHPPRAVPAEDMLRELAAHDVCIVPSIWLETGPLAVYEAMAAGLPIIGSRLGGIAERVRDGLDGLLFTPGDSGQLAKIIDSLLNAPGKLTRLKANIRPQRTFDDMSRELDFVYRGGTAAGAKLCLHGCSDTLKRGG